MKKLLLIFVFLICTIAYSEAQINKSPATKKQIEYKQPDGTILPLFLKGDENLHCAVTIDGYTLLSNKEGGYEYAKLDKNKCLISSGKLAHDSEKRTKKEIRFLKKIEKGLWFNEKQLNKN